MTLALGLHACLSGTVQSHQTAWLSNLPYCDCEENLKVHFLFLLPWGNSLGHVYRPRIAVIVFMATFIFICFYLFISSDFSPSEIHAKTYWYVSSRVDAHLKAGPSWSTCVLIYCRFPPSVFNLVCPCQCGAWQSLYVVFHFYKTTQQCCAWLLQ